MLAAFVCGWRIGWFWVAAALATLTKGPQFPVMLLAALVLVERQRGSTLRALAHRLRPLAGFALVLAVTVHAPIGLRAVLGEWLGWRGRSRDLVLLAFAMLLAALGMRAVFAVFA